MTDDQTLVWGFRIWNGNYAFACEDERSAREAVEQNSGLRLCSSENGQVWSDAA